MILLVPRFENIERYPSLLLVRPLLDNLTRMSRFAGSVEWMNLSQRIQITI
jgi:hypothetical protein